MTRLRCGACSHIFHADSADISPEGCPECSSVTAFRAPALPVGFRSYQPDADALDCGYELLQLIAAWREEDPIVGDGTDVAQEIEDLIAELREDGRLSKAPAGEARRAAS